MDELLLIPQSELLVTEDFTLELLDNTQPALVLEVAQQGPPGPAGVAVAPVTLVSGATVAVNASLSNNFRLDLAVNATLSNPTLLTDGMVLNFCIKQDAIGGRTLAYGTAFKFPGGTAPVLSTAANATDFMSCYFDSFAGTLLCNLNKGFA